MEKEKGWLVYRLVRGNYRVSQFNNPVEAQIYKDRYKGSFIQESEREIHEDSPDIPGPWIALNNSKCIKGKE